MTTKTTRRNFLKTAAVTAAALPAVNLSRMAHAQGSDIVKIGMLGAGGRCTGAAYESMEGDPSVRLVAMFDVFEDRVKGKRDYLRGSKPDQVLVDEDHTFWEFDGYKHVIDSSDIVLIACASKFHSMYAEAAIAAGKHVFVEKPHAIDTPGLKRLERALKMAKEKNLCLVSGLHSRFNVPWQETMKRIHDGAIGEIVTLQGTFLRGPYGLVGRNPSLSETQYQFSNWYHFAWLSGDDVTQSLVHNVDRACWAMQEVMPKHAFGLGGRATSFGEIFGDMFDHNTAVYEYASGARAYMMCRTANGCYDSYADYIQGTKGRCDLNACAISGENPWQYRGPGCNPYLEEQKALVQAAKSGESFQSDYAIGSSMMVLMGQYACYQGNMVSWDDAYKSEYLFGGQLPDEVSFATEAPSYPDETGNYPIPIPGITKFV